MTLMTHRFKPRPWLLLAGVLLASAAVHAAEIKVLTTGAYKPVVTALVGPLPAEIQNYTVYAGAVWVKALDGAAAQAFLATLAGPAAAAVLKDKGMEAP